MAKRSNQKLKILYLMQILLQYTDQNHGLSINEIIEKLSAFGIEAERKSLYDDLELLRIYGLDIEKNRTASVKYYIASRDFELPELKLLVDAVQSSKFITRRKSNELIKKLESFASVYEAGVLNRQVFVANRIKTMNESIYYSVDYIHNAISENRQISFKYFDWNIKKEKQLRKNGQPYVVSPWALTWDDENYYLIAFDDSAKKIKHYRVDKMLELSVLDEKRLGGDCFNNFDMAVYSKQTFGMYGGEETSVKLRCKNGIAGRVIDRFGSDIIMIPDGDEYFTVTVKVAISPLFYTWIMNFGEDIKIISPESAVDGIVKTALDALNQYRSN